MIDLTLLPAPNVVEPLDFETILAEIKAEVLADDPSLADALEFESEPFTKLLQAFAYRELTLRQRINDAARSVMLAYAQKDDLDQIGARYGVARLLIQAAAPNAVPPLVAVYETDKAFLRRILLKLESFTTAGSKASYIYHALTASGDVLDANATSPAPGQVSVYVLSRFGDGTASVELLATVAAALDADLVRPMTDLVSVFSASIVNYAIEAALLVSHGPDSGTVHDSAQVAAQLYADGQHRLEAGVSLSGIYRALHQPGVTSVDLATPTGNVVVSPGQAAYCSSITLTTELGGV